MRSKSSLFYGLVVIAVGILLLVLNGHAELLSWVVILMGVSLAVPCCYTLISTLSASRQASRDGNDTMGMRLMNSGNIITSVIGMALGLWMIINPGFFIGFLAYAFAALLIIYGIYEIVQMGWVYRVNSFMLYVIPALMIVAGLVILCSSVHTIQYTVVLITGIALICAGFNSIMGYATAPKA